MGCFIFISSMFNINQESKQSVRALQQLGASSLVGKAAFVRQANRSFVVSEVYEIKGLLC